MTRLTGDEEAKVRFPLTGPLDVFASDPDEYPILMRSDEDEGYVHLVIISMIGYAALVWCIEHQRLYTIDVHAVQRA